MTKPCNCPCHESVDLSKQGHGMPLAAIQTLRDALTGKRLEFPRSAFSEFMRIKAEHDLKCAENELRRAKAQYEDTHLGSVDRRSWIEEQRDAYRARQRPCCVQCNNVDCICIKAAPRTKDYVVDDEGVKRQPDGHFDDGTPYAIDWDENHIYINALPVDRSPEPFEWYIVAVDEDDDYSRLVNALEDALSFVQRLRP